jgi:hypothetical protein
MSIRRLVKMHVKLIHTLDSQDDGEFRIFLLTPEMIEGKESREVVLLTSIGERKFTAKR